VACCRWQLREKISLKWIRVLGPTAVDCLIFFKFPEHGLRSIHVPGFARIENSQSAAVNDCESVAGHSFGQKIGTAEEPVLHQAIELAGAQSWGDG
jgi:hypothetical protein